MPDELMVPSPSHGSNMNENDKLIKYHLGNQQLNEDFLKEVERIKKSGRRLSNQEKAELLRKMRPVVYSV